MAKAKKTIKKPVKNPEPLSDTQVYQRVDVVVRLQALHVKLVNVVPGGGSVEERQGVADELKAIIDDLQPMK